MILSRNGRILDMISPSYVNKNIIISIDSSKSNTAMFVASPEGHIYDDYEISGAGSDVDVYDLCWDTRRAFKTILKDAHVVQVGIEDIITKKQGDYGGLKLHESRAKITAVFNSFISFFQDNFNLMPMLINNNTWKSHVLPEEYRKRTHDKGSKDWLADIGSFYGNRTDDICDAYCILQYMLQDHKIRAAEYFDNIYIGKIDYEVFLVSEICLPEDTVREFNYEPSWSLEDNLKTAASIIAEYETAFIKVPISIVPIEYVYNNLVRDKSLTYKRGMTEIYVCVQRCS